MIRADVAVLVYFSSLFFHFIGALCNGFMHIGIYHSTTPLMFLNGRFCNTSRFLRRRVHSFSYAPMSLVTHLLRNVKSWKWPISSVVYAFKNVPMTPSYFLHWYKLRLRFFIQRGSDHSVSCSPRLVCIGRLGAVLHFCSEHVCFDAQRDVCSQWRATDGRFAIQTDGQSMWNLFNKNML